VVIAIIAVLASIGLPAMTRVRDKGQNSKCVSNLKSLHAASMLFAQDFNGLLPMGNTTATAPDFNDQWHRNILPYIKEGSDSSAFATLKLKTFLCPSDKTPYGGATLSYSMNALLGEKRLVNLDHSVIFIGDSTNSYKLSTANSEQALPRHGKFRNVIFTDGHVEALEKLPSYTTNKALWDPSYSP
jgi:prepilin-type processing-associated H-X9-DG protein